MDACTLADSRLLEKITKLSFPPYTPAARINQLKTGGGQDKLAEVQTELRIRKERDFCDFGRSLVVGAGPVVNLLGFPRTTISRVWSV